jgi:hypothetical protein
LHIFQERLLPLVRFLRRLVIGSLFLRVRQTDNVANMKNQMAGAELGRELDPDAVTLLLSALGQIPT